MTRLSVVIPAYNAARTLGQQLDALLEQAVDGGFEIIVADNGSTDGTAALVRSYQDRAIGVRFVDASARRGASFARNRGAEAAAASSIAFCDADDVVGPSWLRAMAASIPADGYVTGPIELDRLNLPWLAQSRSWLTSGDVLSFDGVLPFAVGCNVGVRRDALLAVGGFDEDLLVGEDIDLALRLRSQGLELAWQDDAVVHYRLRSDTREIWRQGRDYAQGHEELRGRLRAADLTPQKPALPWRRLLWLLRKLPTLRTTPGRVRWVWVAAQCRGELSGLVSVHLRHRLPLSGQG